MQKWINIAVTMTSALALYACAADQNEPAEPGDGPMENAGEEVDEAAEGTADEAEDAGEEIDEAAEEATDEAEDAVE